MVAEMTHSFVIDRSFIIRNISQTLLEHLGQPVTRLQNQKCFQIFYNRQTPCEICPAEKSFLENRIIATRLDTGFFEPTFEQYFARAIPVQDKNNHVTRVIVDCLGNLEDLNFMMGEKKPTNPNDLKTKYLELQKMYNLQFEIFNCLPQYAIIVNSDLRLIGFNKAFANEFSSPEVDLTGQDPALISPLYHHPDFSLAVQRCIQQKRDQSVTFKVNLRSDSVLVEHRLARIPDKTGLDGVLILTHTSVCNTELNEREIFREKFRILGGFSAKLVHDINNPLGVILTRTQMLSQDLADSQDEETKNLKEELDIIIQQAQTISALLEQLGALKSHGEKDMSVIDMAALVEGAIAIAEFSRTNRVIKIEKDISKDLPPYFGCEARLERAFGEICKNALEAANVDGQVQVRLVYSHENGGHYVFKVRDTGNGIVDEVIDKIFDPFFSTKKKKGVGMGLTIASTAVLDHGGDIHVESFPGRGTEVTVTLPRVEAKRDK